MYKIESPLYRGTLAFKLQQASEPTRRSIHRTRTLSHSALWLLSCICTAAAPHISLLCLSAIPSASHCCRGLPRLAAAAVQPYPCSAFQLVPLLPRPPTARSCSGAAIPGCARGQFDPVPLRRAVCGCMAGAATILQGGHCMLHARGGVRACACWLCL